MLVGVDIGGSRVKLAILVKQESDSTFVHEVLTELCEEEATLEFSETFRVPNSTHFIHFISFPTSKLSRKEKKSKFVEEMTVTGGGGFKFQEILLKHVNKIHQLGEIQALYDGLQFLVKSASKTDFFTCTNVRFAGMLGMERQRILTEQFVFDNNDENYILVNIGSGVSFVDCSNSNQYTRVGGSSLGGAAFHGLVTLLCGENNFDKALDLASSGDSTKVDLLVGDIYSNSQESNKKLEDLGLRASTLAASFGKMANYPNSQVSKSDLALACLIMVALNVAAMAHLHALYRKRKYVLFCGSFLGRSNGSGRNTLAIRTLTYGIEFWGQMKGMPMKAIFLRREGFLGALGALTTTQAFQKEVCSSTSHL